MPESEYTGAGAIKALTAFTATEANTPHWTIQLDQSGIDLYWDGVEFTASDGTYSQSNTSAEINTNIGSLDVDGDIYILPTPQRQGSALTLPFLLPYSKKSYLNRKPVSLSGILKSIKFDIVNKLSYRSY